MMAPSRTNKLKVSEKNLDVVIKVRPNTKTSSQKYNSAEPSGRSRMKQIL